MDKQLKEVSIWTDGACSGNPGPGGWGAILEYAGRRKELSGGERATTNNRMELIGVISALQCLKVPCAVTLYSDSQYIINAMTKGWVQSWQKKGWKKADGQPVKNPELFQELVRLCAIHRVKFIWVRGHAENQNNNRCDEMAVAQRDKMAAER